MVDGIEIDKDIAEETLLPDDLNSLAVGSYVVPISFCFFTFLISDNCFFISRFL